MFESYPDLFAGRNEPITHSLIPFGIETGDGWFDLIWELCTKIDALAKSAGLSGDDYPKAMQVKEKFGGLRFYANPCNVKVADEVFAAIDEAEARSVKTCETCGKPGRQVGGGWIVTICEACESKRDEQTTA